MKLFLPGLVLLTAVVGVAAPPLAPFESPSSTTPAGPVDAPVLRRLEGLGVKPAHGCSDSVFVRRIYLDVIGTLPTAEEARSFLADSDPDRRRVLIDRLLARDEFADYWAMKWGDLLRIKAEYPINLWPNAAQLYDRWIRASLRENRPYDRFVRELITASGSNFQVPTANFYRAVQGRDATGLAQVVALTFMGTRTDQWPAGKFDGMAACFAHVGYKSTAEWKEEIVYFDPAKLANDVTNLATLPDGTRLRLTPEHDPREQFAEWLVRPQNPWFARSVVNRIWAWLLGRGLVQEPDDFRPDNPPWDPDVLDYLERELVAAQFDLKAIYRLVLNSRTYQQSFIPASDPSQADTPFASYPLRRLEAEVLMDALCRITGTTEKYTSPIPEPFTVLPDGARAITLPDGSITSPFLELFGRSPRDTGLDSERNNQSSAAQRLHLLNSSHVRRKIEQAPVLRALPRANRDPRQAVNRIYLTVLSRFPTAAELQTIKAYGRSGEAAWRDTAVDLLWALLNSPEFLYRH